MNHIGTKRIETKRLLLRPFSMDDAERMYRNCLANKEVTKFLHFKPYANVQEVEDRFSTWMRLYENPDFYHWAITWKKTKEAVGTISLNQLKESTKKASAGYYLKSELWHQGLGTEALSAVLDFAFYEIGLNRVEARHDVKNPYSGAVMRNCGMTYEGTFRQADCNNTGIYDVVQYAVLAEEYDKWKEEKRRKERKMIVSINSIELVKEFAKVVAESGKRVIAASGQYRVDASSLMGLFSLNLTKPITLEFSEDCEELKVKLQKFLYGRKK